MKAREEEVQRLQVELNHLKRVSMGKERHISRLEEEKLVMQKKIDQQLGDLEMLQQKGGGYSMESALSANYSGLVCILCQ